MVRRQAKEFVSTNEVTKTSLYSVTFLESCLTKLDYVLHWFSSPKDELAIRLDVADLCASSLAFSVKTSEYCCVFISAKVSNDIAAQLILHEIGHILLGHLTDNEIAEFTDRQENEANEFTDEVRRIVASKPKQKRIAIVTAAVLAFVLSISAVIQSVQSESANTPVPVSGTQISVFNTEMTVFVTKSGDKYHRENCPHIKDSETTELTVEDAERLGYEPCKNCFGST